MIAIPWFSPFLDPVSSIETALDERLRAERRPSAEADETPIEVAADRDGPRSHYPSVLGRERLANSSAARHAEARRGLLGSDDYQG